MAFIGNQIITLNSLLDLDGQELVLDADADSTIHVSTDDQIDFKIGGTDVATFTNSSSDFVITQAVQDKDIIFKGDDGGSAITALTLDMSDAGNATFNGTVTAAGGSSNNNDDANILTLNATQHARLLVDTASTSGHRASLVLESNGQETTLGTTGSASELAVPVGDLTLDVAGDIILDADGGDVRLSDGGTQFGKLHRDSGDFKISSSENDKDIIFMGADGGADIEAMRIDMSEGGDVLIGKTSSDSGTAGHELLDYGRAVHTANATTVQVVNRLSSDGDIAIFQKDGSTVGSIASSSGDLLIDAPADIILDADGAEVKIADGGTNIGNLFNSSNDFTIKSLVNDADLVFKGEDGGSTVTAAFFDMSDGGTFRTGSIGTSNPGAGSNGTIIVNGTGGVLITGDASGNTSALRIYSTNSGSPTAAISATGALSKASGSFKINHPLESKKDTHYLVHSFIEGPQADLIYRGKVTLSSGTATVNIDTVSGMTEGTFVALNTNVQCFTSNESGWTAIKGSVSGNTLTITAQDNSCTDTISWMVVGERHDPHMKDSGTDWADSDGKVIVEPEKESE